MLRFGRRRTAFLRDHRALVASRIARIPGWLPVEAALMSAHLNDVQRALGLEGPVLEIGVFRGKYLALLYALSRPGEPVVGVDLFVGSDDKATPAAMARGHVAAAAGGADRLRILVEDSLALTSGRLSAETGGRGCRFVSIDGGHTRELVRHDLEVCTPLLMPGGVMALDDALNHTTPGVAEGIIEFFHTRRPPLAPFTHCYNKLFVTTPDYHARYLAAAHAFLEQATWLPTHERTTARLRENSGSGFRPAMFGYEILAFL